MTNAEKIKRLRGLIARSQSAKAVVDDTIAGLQTRAALASLRHMASDDRAILDCLPIAAAATYQCADLWDAMMARSRLHTCGSMVDAVTLELAAEQLREQRARP